MKNRKSKQHTAHVAGMLVVWAMFVVQAPTFGQDELIIKGRVIAPSHLQAPVQVTMEALSDGERMEVDIHRNGRFHIVAPANEEYLIHFTQRGTIGKTIKIDGRNAVRRHAVKDRTVAFDVVLAASDHAERLAYAAPVGRIGFVTGTGRMSVVHQYLLSGQSTSLVVDGMK